MTIYEKILYTKHGLIQLTHYKAKCLDMVSRNWAQYHKLPIFSIDRENIQNRNKRNKKMKKDLSMEIAIYYLIIDTMNVKRIKK